MHKKPMTKIQFMIAVRRRWKKKQAAMRDSQKKGVEHELGKKGVCEVVITGRPKFYVAVNSGSTPRGGIKIFTKQPSIFQDKTESKLIMGLRKAHAGRDNVADPLSFLQRKYRNMRSAGLEGDPMIDPGLLGDDTTEPS